ncbi:MAG: hypothetical protein DMF06_04990 [Verrucomicrobia bacterium]|jgi:hypothetical protein|nr:MAG: hypothetical protein DMF06_04990 [Verrucomicrobiota bacterium]
MAFTLIPEPVGFEPKRRFPCPEFRMDPWLPPAEHAELQRRAAAVGITTREYAMQAVRFAMAQERAA